MTTVVRKKKRTSKRLSRKKLFYTGILLAGIILLGPPLFRSVKMLWNYGFAASDIKQHDNILNFGVILPSGFEIHGIDISHHQKDIAWKDVAAINVNGTKIQFAFIKATEGITRQDLHFSSNWKKCKEAGLVRGAYHFYYPSRDAKKQAENFISQVNLVPGDLPPVLDIELSKGKSKAEIVKGCQEWCKVVEDKYGVKPIIYTNPAFYDKYLKDDFEDYPLWVAHYYQEMPRMEHRDWIFWQHTDCATIKGIKKPVDLNVFNGDLDDLMNMCLE